MDKKRAGVAFHVVEGPPRGEYRRSGASWNCWARWPIAPLLGLGLGVGRSGRPLVAGHGRPDDKQDANVVVNAAHARVLLFEETRGRVR